MLSMGGGRDINFVYGLELQRCYNLPLSSYPHRPMSLTCDIFCTLLRVILYTHHNIFLKVTYIVTVLMICRFHSLLFEDQDSGLFSVTLFRKAIDDFRHKAREMKYVFLLLSRVTYGFLGTGLFSSERSFTSGGEGGWDYFCIWVKELCIFYEFSIEREHKRFSNIVKRHLVSPLGLTDNQNKND